MNPDQTTTDKIDEASPIQGVPLPFLDVLQTETSTMAEALFTIIPVLAYGCVYYVRLRIYQWLGLSRQLVSVRIEDVLFITVCVLVLYWSHLAGWLAGLVGKRERDKRVLGVVGVAFLLVLVAQTAMIAILTIRYHVVDIYQYVTLVLQAFLFVLWILARSNRGFFGHREKTTVNSAMFVCAALFVALAVGHAAYLSFNNLEYQYCAEDNALIITYVDEGRAVEKEIVRMDNNGECELAPGYVINDIEGKHIQVTRFGHIVANE